MSIRNGITALGAVVAITAVGIGCGDGSVDPAAKPTTSEVSTTTVRTGTVGQAAGVVAQYEAKIRKAEVDVEACFDLSDRECDTVALLGLTTLRSTASTFGIVLDAFDDPRPGNRGYVGAFPAEVAGLATRTIESTKELVAEIQLVEACLPNKTGAKCSGPSLPLSTAYARLVALLDAWRPYL